MPLAAFIGQNQDHRCDMPLAAFTGQIIRVIDVIWDWLPSLDSGQGNQDHRCYMRLAASIGTDILRIIGVICHRLFHWGGYTSAHKCNIP